MEIIKNPTTIKLLSQEIIKACDLYLSLKLSEDKLRALVWYYGNNHGEKLFKVKDLNPTLLNRIGKKRASLIEKMLVGFQTKML